jgi:putative flippase GtrA
MRALARYACVGAAATALHYAVLVALVNWTATPPPAAAATGAVLGAQLAYVGNRAFTFTDRRPWWASWWRFQATAVLGAVLSASLVALGSLSLIAIINDAEAQFQIWRIGSAAGAALGIFAAGFALARGHLTPAQKIGEVLTLILFVVIGLLSFIATPLFGLKPITLEAFASVGALALTAHVIWQFFVEKAD